MRRVRQVTVAVVLGVALVAPSLSAWAADPLDVAPTGVYTVQLDNERIRVMELRVAPGVSIPMHSHPDHLVYVTGGGTLQLTHPDGSRVDLTAEPGQVLWIPAESHATLNVGDTEVRGLVVELKG